MVEEVKRESQSSKELEEEKRGCNDPTVEVD